MLFNRKRIKFLCNEICKENFQIDNKFRLKEMEELFFYYNKVKGKDVSYSAILENIVYKFNIVEFILIITCVVSLWFISFVFFYSLDLTLPVVYPSIMIFIFVYPLFHALFKQSIKNFFQNMSKEDYGIIIYYIKEKSVNNEKEEVIKKTNIDKYEKILMPTKRRL